MPTSAAQDRAFLAAVISQSLLEDAISWIADDMEPEDVFEEKKLREWALNNGFESTGGAE